MANEEQLAILKQGVDVWNEWREKQQVFPIDLRKANLVGTDLELANLAGIDLTGADLSRARLRGVFFRGAYLTGADFTGADLTSAYFGGAYLRGAYLRSANLTGTNFTGAYLRGADLRGADLSEADLRGADLRGADLSEADLSEADLSEADLRTAQIVNTLLRKANLSNCRIFGISAWNVNLEGATQANLIITDEGAPIITVDNLEVAQFIYLLLHNEKLRDVIDTIGKKAVLILGRFTDERLAVLQAIREELRQRDYIPILFDFEKPDTRDVTETIVTLAHMARFIVADLTDAKSIPQELSHIVPDLPSVAVQPLIFKGQREYGMFEHFQRYPWVLPIHEYETQEQLIEELSEKVIVPAEAKVAELRPTK